MIPHNEKLLPLVEAVEAATSRRPHLSTPLRWCTRGVKGIRLASRVLGGRRLTSVEAVLRFSDACQVAKDGPLIDVTSPKQESIRAKKSADKLAEIVGG